MEHIGISLVDLSVYQIQCCSQRVNESTFLYTSYSLIFKHLFKMDVSCQASNLHEGYFVFYSFILLFTELDNK